MIVNAFVIMGIIVTWEGIPLLCVLSRGITHQINSMERTASFVDEVPEIEQSKETNLPLYFYESYKARQSDANVDSTYECIILSAACLQLDS